jgi:hypothetical protein
MYGIPIALASLLSMKEAKGQDQIWRRSFPLPTEPINLFISQDSTPQALEYNALTTKEAMDAAMLGKVTSDITSKVQGLVCNKSSALFTLDSKNFGKDIYDSDNLIYGGYDGDDYNEILLHGGTRKYFGTLGIPTGIVEIVDVLHGMNYVITGDKIKDPKSYNFIEAAWPWAATNVQPGQVYIPMNADTVLLYYTYTYKNDQHNKNIANIPVVWFKIVNGKYIFQGTNPYVKLIEERESDPPIINIKTGTDPDSLVYNMVHCK